MPLRDHFRPPASKKSSWEELHGQWPAAIVQQLRRQLPPGFVAGPRVHTGAFVEVDIATYEKDDAPAALESNGGDATALWSLEPAVAVETELEDEAEYEVRVYDSTHERQLVATIELVSPGNKDRAQKRNAFVAKCAGLLRQGVAVSIVDLVTVRHHNLFAEMMAFIGHGTLAPAGPPAVYAASCRTIERDGKHFLDTCERPLTVGQPLPTIPLWLGADRALALDLESSYEQACHDLRIT